MPIWRLEPIDFSDANWEASSHRGAVTVRADSEREAREAAQEAFGVKTRFDPGHRTFGPPWLRDSVVAAHRLKDTEFDEEGPTEILDPSL